MEACIAWAKSTSTVVFNDNLATSRRFGFTPALWEPTFSSPSTTYYIKSYLPVYIDTIMFGCSNNRCNVMYTPGVSTTGNCVNNPPEARTTCGVPGAHNQNMDVVTAYILSQAIVPTNAKSPSPGAANQRVFSLVE
jgi:hypothetical protein